jgi:hypothetical protein
MQKIGEGELLGLDEQVPVSVMVPPSCFDLATIARAIPPR